MSTTAQVKKNIAPISLMLLVFLLLLSLGFWQKHRLSWKEGAIKRYEVNASKLLDGLPQDSQGGNLRLGDVMFSQVRLHGEVVASPICFVGSGKIAKSTQNGYFCEVAVPIKVKSGSVILVFLGVRELLSGDFNRNIAKKYVQVGDVVSGTAMIRSYYDLPHSRLVSNNLQEGRWYSISRKEIDDFYNISDASVDYFLVMSDGFGLLARSNLVDVYFVNNHFQYMMTWYLLALIWGVGCFVALRARVEGANL